MGAGAASSCSSSSSLLSTHFVAASARQAPRSRAASLGECLCLPGDRPARRAGLPDPERTGVETGDGNAVPRGGLALEMANLVPWSSSVCSSDSVNRRDVASRIDDVNQPSIQYGIYIYI